MNAAFARSLIVSASTSARRSVADRGGLLFTVGFHLLVSATLTGLWRAAISARGTDIAGYGAAAITWYIATTELVTVSINNRLVADVAQDITSGMVAVELLRPASVLAQRVAIEVGRVVPRIGVCVLSLLAIAWLGGAPPQNARSLALLPWSLLLAVTVNIITQHAFAGIAFWVGDTSASWFLYQKLVFMLGGMLLPLQVLPDWLERLAWLTPFPAMAYAPGRLAAGHAEAALLLAQAGWLVASGALATLVFARGEPRLQVVGG